MREFKVFIDTGDKKIDYVVVNATSLDIENGRLMFANTSDGGLKWVAIFEYGIWKYVWECQADLH